MSNTSDIRVSNDGGQKVIKFSIVIINLLHNFSDSPFNEVTLSCLLKLPWRLHSFCVSIDFDIKVTFSTDKNRVWEIELSIESNL